MKFIQRNVFNMNGHNKVLIVALLSWNAFLLVVGGDPLMEYLQTVNKDSGLDVTVVMSGAEYYSDGTVELIDSIGFTSKSKAPIPVMVNFNLSSLSNTTIKKLVGEAKDKGLALSLFHDVADDDVQIETFNTEEFELPDSPAAEIALSENFVEGLQEEIAYTIDQAERTASMKVLEYRPDGKLERNRTAVFHIFPITVLHDDAVSAKMSKAITTEIKKAYKVDVEDRAPIIAHLLGKKFHKYNWQVLVNSTTYLMDRNVYMTLQVGNDEYDVIGKLK